MAYQSERGPLDFEFPDVMADLGDSFAFLNIDDTRELWADNQTSLLRGQISSVMYMCLGNTMWMENQPLALHEPDCHVVNSSDNVDAALSNLGGHKSEHTSSSSSGPNTSLTPPEVSTASGKVSCQAVVSPPRRPKRTRFEVTEFMGSEASTTERRRWRTFSPRRKLASTLESTSPRTLQKIR
jgi:hypothetical protein